MWNETLHKLNPNISMLLSELKQILRFSRDNSGLTHYRDHYTLFSLTNL